MDPQAKRLVTWIDDHLRESKMDYKDEFVIHSLRTLLEDCRAALIRLGGVNES